MHLKGITIHGGNFPTCRFYPFNTSAIQQTSKLSFNSPVTFFVGENGSGKSTLLDAIARCCGIHFWDKPRRHLAHANPYENRLAEFITPTWSNGMVPGSMFRAETFRDLADFLDDVALCDPGRLHYHGGRILNTLSHGEGILSYFGGRFRCQGLYFLDEPEAALSPTSQIQFLNLLSSLAAGGQAQFIIASHSPILLACPGAQIMSFDSSGVQEVGYEETTHYQVYKAFMTDRSAYLSSQGTERRASY